MNALSRIFFATLLMYAFHHPLLGQHQSDEPPVVQPVEVRSAVPDPEFTGEPWTLWSLVPDFIERGIRTSEKSKPPLLAPATSEELALFFDGRSGVVKISNSPSLSLTGNHTIEFWFRPIQPGKRQVLFQKVDKDGPGLAIELTEESKVSVKFVSADSSTKPVVLSSYEQVAINTWSHVAVTIRPTWVELFVNGGRHSESSKSPLSQDFGEIVIGSLDKKSSFAGFMDEIRISNFIRYSDTHSPERRLFGGGIYGTIAGTWRFANQRLFDTSGNGNHATIEGDVTFVPEDIEVQEVSGTQKAAKEMLSPITIDFDTSPNGPITQGTFLHNMYPGVSFYETTGLPMHASYYCSDNGPCQGQSLPFFANAQDSSQNVAFLFAQPATVHSFMILGVNDYPGWPTNRVSFKQDGQYYTFVAVSNGYDVPIQVRPELSQCGTGPCDRITEIRIHSIYDYAGLGYDNFSYTTYSQTTPTPPDCLTGHDSVEISGSCQPTPTPTPAIPNAPTDLTIEELKGKVRLKWKWTATATNPTLATSWKVERSDSSTGPWQDYHSVSFPESRGYVDEDVNLKIDQDRYYRVSAVNSLGVSGPSNVASGSPLSACHDYQTFNRPTPPTSEGFPFSAYGWTGTYKFEHGLSVRNVALNGRMMAKNMGVAQVWVTSIASVPGDPFARIDLDLTAAQQHGYVSKLYEFNNRLEPNRGNNSINLEAKYCISSASGQEQWDVTILHRFDQEKPRDTCEPSMGLPCARFYPLVTFNYYRRRTAPQGKEESAFYAFPRLHFRENDDANNIVALVTDCDKLKAGPIEARNECYWNEFPVDKRSTVNPLKNETSLVPWSHLYSMGEHGTYLRGDFDNIHQTGIDKVTLPGPLNNEDFSLAGCPSCVHMHWRWTGHWLTRLLSGAQSRPGTFSGIPIIGPKYLSDEIPTAYPEGSFQHAIGGICKYKPEEFDSPTTLSCENKEPIYQSVRNSPSSSVSDSGSDLVFLYKGVSTFTPIHTDGIGKYSDVFLAHGGFFQPVRARNIEKVLNITTNTAVPQPTKLLVENYYKHPEYSSEHLNATVDTTATSTLPPNYTKVAGSEYRVTLPARSLLPLGIPIGADISGTHVLTYKVPATVSLEQFNSMRILHNETDKWETAWVDRTILTGADAPDFQTKTIKARVSSIGRFLVATVSSGSNSVSSAVDVKVQGSVAPASVNAGDVATYDFTVTNQSSTPAPDVILLSTFDGRTSFVSVTPSVGHCDDGQEQHSLTPEHVIAPTNTVRCKLGDLAPNSSVTVSLVVRVNIFGDGIDTTPIEIDSWTEAASAEDEVNWEDNRIQLMFQAVPSSNKPPTVSVAESLEGTTMHASWGWAGTEMPQVPITISASDSDGTIQEVTVYDNGELVGTATAAGSGQYTFTFAPTTYGFHMISARAVDNGGRITDSGGRRVLINSPAYVSFTGPTEGQFVPGSTISISTNSYLPYLQGMNARSKSKLAPTPQVELFISGQSFGKMSLVSNDFGSMVHQFNWTNAPRGRYEIMAILEDSSEASISQSKSFVVTDSPAVSINTPSDGASFPEGTTVDVNIDVADTDGFVKKIELYANGALVGVRNENIASGTVSVRWEAPPDGIYSLVAVATDDMDVSTSSSPVNMGINRPVPTVGEQVWVDDAVPSGASSGGNDGWNWSERNPGSLMGRVAHHSALMNGEHEHFFENATQKLQVNPGEKLSAWIFVDPVHRPAEVMLQWKDDQGWEHRAYWGDNLIPVGTDGTASRRRIGDIPSGVGWKQLIVPADLVGLEGKLINGMKFSLHGGRAAWDRVGKLLASAPDPGPGDSDVVWVDDAPPSGAILEAYHDTWTDGTWISSSPAPYSGTVSHRNWDQDNNEKYRHHAFRNAPNALSVQPGDNLFTYVYLYPGLTTRPDTLVLQWYDSVSGWEHRAYWGRDLRKDVPIFNGLAANYEGWRYMGPLPGAGKWARLEVPASYVGLEGKQVSGMSFGAYRHGKGGRAVWDYAGKSPTAQKTQLPLSFSTPLFRYSCWSGYRFYLYSTDRDETLWNTDCSVAGVVSSYVYTHQIEGTTPLYRYSATSGNPNRRLYTTCDLPACHTGYDNYEGIVAYVRTAPVADEVQWKVWSCENTYYYSTFPNPPDVTSPTSCTPIMNQSSQLFIGYSHGTVPQ